MYQATLALELTVRGPFLSKSSAMGGHGVDAVALRTADGRAVLPDGQVRGRLREALEELSSIDPRLVDDVAAWFGPPVNVDDEQVGDGVRPRALFATEFLGPAPANPDAAAEDRYLTRIRIGAEGTVARGAMLVIDPAARPGQDLTFSGEIEVWDVDIARLTESIRRIVRGLSWVPSFGSFRSVGFGEHAGPRLRGVSVVAWKPTQSSAAASDQSESNDLRTELNGWIAAEDPVEVRSVRPGPASSASAVDLDGKRFDLTVTMLDPFCVGGRRTSRNVTASLPYLPGAVLKGALAAALRRVEDQAEGFDLRDATDGPWAGLARALSDLRFCAAFPAAADGPAVRPTWQPASLVKDPTGRVWDVALEPGPFLFRRGDERFAPGFALDWKDPATPHWESGWKWPGRELRLRTSIDPTFRRARTEHLFGQEMIRPEGVVWRGMVDLERVDAGNRLAVWRALRAFLDGGCLRVGKTKARARVALGTEPLAVPTPAETDGPWVVTLQSPALLVDPRLETVPASLNPTADEAFDLFARSWDELSHGALKLVRHFARQSLHGGFLASRAAHSSRGTGGRAYNPFLATDAGSVFVLSATSDPAAARACLARWLTRGLDLTGWAATAYGASYTTNPFLPEDGFGEIAVDLSCHRDLRPMEIDRL